MFDYASIKMVHVMCASLSVVLFLWRSFFCFVQPQAPQPRWSRTTPQIVNTFLLLSGVMLAFTLRNGDGWVIAKFIGAVLYVSLAWFALRRRRPAAFWAACVVFAYVVCVAVTRSPLGPIALF